MKSLFASFLLSCSTLSYGSILIFDDFSGDALGATRTIGNSATLQSSLTTATPLSTHGGRYLTSQVNGNTAGYPKPLSYMPISMANSWEAITGSVTVNQVAYTTLQGSFDMYFRINSFATMVDSTTQQLRPDTHFLRPVDLNGTSANQAVRMIVEGTTLGSLSFSLQGLTTGMIGTSATTFNLNSRSITLNNYANWVQEGDIHHLGITFDTNLSTGQITMKLFLRESTEGIDTTSTEHLIGSNSFYMNDTVARGSNGDRSIFGGLRAWDLVNRDATTSDPLSGLSIDYDGIRLQSGVVTQFEALGVPEPSRWLTAFIGLSALLLRRKRR